MVDKNEKTKNPNRVGAGWTKKDKKGNEFISIVIDKIEGDEFRGMVMKNQYKEGKTQPDYVVMKYTDKKE